MAYEKAGRRRIGKKGKKYPQGRRLSGFGGNTDRRSYPMADRRGTMGRGSTIKIGHAE